jgi:nucleotide-binding universal stress UspA family protein
MKFEPKRILVGADFSECSAAALRLAVQIAEKFSATLVVLHAIPPAMPASPVSRHVLLPARSETLSAVENQLIMFIRGVIGRKRMPDYRIVEGHAAEAVLFAAGYEKVDMIVLGTRGQGGVSRLTLGSVAEQILGLASVPVMTICPRRATKRRPSTLRRILCPVNYSAAAGKAIEVAVSLGRRFGAEVIALYVIEKKSFDGDLDAETERLRVWTCGLVPGPTRPKPLIVAGNGGAEVLRYAEHNDIDLIVVGARRERFSDTTVFGTTTERVTRHAPCAVLTVTVVAESKTTGAAEPARQRRRPA